jgi:hypothetical protein
MSIITYFVAFILVVLADKTAKLSSATKPKLQLPWKNIRKAIKEFFSRKTKEDEEKISRSG